MPSRTNRRPPGRVVQGCRRASAVALAALLAIAGAAGTAWAQPAPRVAAASSLNFALADIARQFTRDRGERVDLVFGSSGALTRQIRDGAPFELFLAADEDFPARLTAAGLTRDSGAVYAIGRLALFAPSGSPLEVDPALNGLASLAAAGRVSRFAIANPSLAPYGRAAEAVLRKHALWDRLRPSLVFGETVAQAAQFATTGNAVGGLVAYSLVVGPELSARGTYALVPATDHPALRQRMVLLRNAGPVAERFYQYLQGPAARAIFRRYGFEAPE